MGKVPQISDTEWQVMKVVWTKSPITANQVVKELESSAKWRPNTVKTLLGRLVRKNALGFCKEGKEYYYYPSVSEKECIREESKSFIQKVYGGALNVMLASFLEEEKLTPEDLKDLKKILDEKIK
ncbi:MAG: BlaI/MecI/CopY family transcriptional regulator [Clostridia bacterium]|nr:BlaI/MecI/CopY family transcriptional regulator [Clostridia bacterium]